MLKAAEKMIAGKANDEDLDFAVDVKMRSLDTPEDINGVRRGIEKRGPRQNNRGRCKATCWKHALRNAIMSGKSDAAEKTNGRGDWIIFKKHRRGSNRPETWPS